MANTLFDPDAARASKHEAMERVERNAEERWKVAAKLSVRELAKARFEFTTDAVWWWLERHYPQEWTPEPRAMGPIMNWAARTGLVAKTDRVVESVREQCHARPIAIWRSQALVLAQKQDAQAGGQ